MSMATESTHAIAFRPPIEEVKLVGYGDQTRASATVLLADANHHLFSMHVETEWLYRQNAQIERGEAEAPGEDAEPTFVLPVQELAPEDLHAVIHGMEPALLQKYLVPQSEELH